MKKALRTLCAALALTACLPLSARFCAGSKACRAFGERGQDRYRPDRFSRIPAELRGLYHEFRRTILL